MFPKHSISQCRCLCSVSKVAGKGAGIVEYLIQLFYKRLDALGFDNKQVGSSVMKFYDLLNVSFSMFG